MVITGEGRFTANFLGVTGSAFPDPETRRYQIGMQCIFRSSGVDPDQVDRIHANRYTFVASVAQEIDVLTLLGGPWVRLLLGKLTVVNPAHVAAELILGGAAINPWPISLPIYPGTTLNHGGLILPSPGRGRPVTASAKQWLMTPSAHAMYFDLMILGSST